MKAPTLRGHRLRLRALTGADAGRLTEILQQPSVARWWHPYDRAEVERSLVGAGERKAVWGIEFEGALVGAIQAYEEDDPQYRHAGIDLFLAGEAQGQGLGVEAIKLLTSHLAGLGHHRIVIDPAMANERAIAAYERAGFSRVGLMRRYCRTPEGEWEDGLLMELIEGDPGWP